MKFTELLAKISGLDQTKEYDIAEITTTPPLPEPEPTHQNKNNEETADENNTPKPDNTTTNANDTKVKELEKQIADLKAANLALLTRTTIEKPPTLEECVLSINGYSVKEDE